MAFWSSEKLAARLWELLDPPNPDMIDCAAITLTIGGEVYVSPTEDVKNPSTRTIRSLKDNEAVAIPPGQLAFLITEEKVTVPHDAIALISIKSGIKLRGLVNVSGFHVDPGYHDHLIFGVLNAGPATIHLRRGEQCFLIWYADLDRLSRKIRVKPGFSNIPASLVSNVAREFKTVEGVSKRVDKLEHQLATLQAIAYAVLSVVLAAVIATFMRYVFPGPQAVAVPTPLPSAVATSSPRVGQPATRGPTRP